MFRNQKCFPIDITSWRCAQAYGIVDPVFESRLGQDFFSTSKSPESALEHTQPPKKWAAWAVSPMVHQPTGAWGDVVVKALRY